MSVEKPPAQQAQQRARVRLPQSKGPQSLPHCQSYREDCANPFMTRCGMESSRRNAGTAWDGGQNLLFQGKEQPLVGEETMGIPLMYNLSRDVWIEQQRI